jgi:hypothetical protein
MNTIRLLAVLVSTSAMSASAQQPAAATPPPPPPIAATKLPVREVTVFKDGHAWVVREAPLPADANGTVVLDELPAPLFGTFWPFALDGARLTSAKAGREKVASEVAATDIRQIARANAGKDVTILTTDKERIDGKLLGVPSRQDDTAPTGDLLLLQTSTGTRALPLGYVRDLEVRGEFTGTLRHEEQKERLTLQVAGGGAGSKVGVMYVQRGLRWIPAYKLDLDGKGTAAVQFEATLVNDLIDLERATVHLVIGVPKFTFEGHVDPISLQQEAAQVSAQVREQIRMRGDYLSNSLMTQTAGFRRNTPEAQEPQPEVEGGAAAEDLFVFTVRDVTLKRGERLVLPIATSAIPYRDLYRLDVSFGPPQEVRRGLNGEQVLQLATLMEAPKARHVLRLRNTGDAPLTTAPALVLAGGRVLAQAHLLYTPRGAETDLEINVAIDVRVETEEHETGREGDALRVADERYGRVRVAGAIELSNRKGTPIELEVTRRELGIADEVGQDGTKRQLDLAHAWRGTPLPAWWGWWSWPHWWFQHNGVAEFRWTVQLAAGASTKLDASWHYLWR